MMTFVIGALFMLVMGFISRSINKKATEKLEEDKKHALVNLFNTINFYMMVVFGFFFVLLIVDLKFEWLDTSIAERITFVFFGLLLIASIYLPIKKLKDHNFPSYFIKMHLLSSVIRTLGIILPIYFITYYYDFF